VRDLNTDGQGVSYAQLEKHLLENYTPRKSQNYSASFIKSYVRDGVNRYNHLSHVNEGNEYSALAAPEPRARSGGGGRKGPTKAQQEKTELLQFVRDQGNVADVSQLDSNPVSSHDMVQASGRKAKSIDKMLDGLEAEGLIRCESVDGTIEGDTVRNVYLTAAGYALANEQAPEGAGSDEEQQRQEAASAATADSQDA
jgi:hypothetical protein